MNTHDQPTTAQDIAEATERVHEAYGAAVEHNGGPDSEHFDERVNEALSNYEEVTGTNPNDNPELQHITVFYG